MTESLFDTVRQGIIPRHIAIIMDGNGRWAQMQGRERTFGHAQGVVPVREAIEGSARLGVQYLTLYAFSLENWDRPQEEIDMLTSLMLSTMKSEQPELMKNNIRVLPLGDISRFSPEIVRDLEAAVQQTANNTGLTVQIALSYSGRWDILQAVNTLLRLNREGKLPSKDITEEIFAGQLSTKGAPDPELLIRTSGEMRISNFLLWQCAYAEFFFTPTLWPDFRREHLYGAILDYQRRERRFGKTSAQVMLGNL